MLILALVSPALFKVAAFVAASGGAAVLLALWVVTGTKR